MRIDCRISLTLLWSAVALTHRQRSKLHGKLGFQKERGLLMMQTLLWNAKQEWRCQWSSSFLSETF